MHILSEIGWRPGIGDATFAGWLTVFAYLLAAVLCWRRSRVDVYRRSWLFIAAVLIALGVNKQLDLQTLFTDLGREVAKAQGWYDQRRSVQNAFIFGISGLAAACALLMGYLWIRYPLGSLRVAMLGFCFLLAFVVVRAASMHHFDRFIGLSVLGLRVNWVLELGGIAIIAIASLLRPRRLADAASPVSPRAAPHRRSGA